MTAPFCFARMQEARPSRRPGHAGRHRGRRASGGELLAAVETSCVNLQAQNSFEAGDAPAGKGESSYWRLRRQVGALGEICAE